MSKTDGVFDNVIENKYDTLDRLRRTIHNTDITEEYGYDALGNKIWVQDGRGNRANYTYNAVGWLTAVTDPLQQTTRFQYDPNGNRVRQVSANHLTTQFNYDELNRLVEKIDSLNKSTKISYDLNGNRSTMVDPRGSNWAYQYYDNNLLEKVDVTNTGNTPYSVEYTYDAAGNRKTVVDSGNTVKYNFQGEVYNPDPLNRVNSIDRTFDETTYRTGYHYNKALLTGIVYPEATSTLTYNYNNINQLTEVVGFTVSNGITYDADGALHNIAYANGVSSTYSYDANRRLSALSTVKDSSNILKLSYTYDQSNNITRINDTTQSDTTHNNDKIYTYRYDANNQLTQAVTYDKYLLIRDPSGDPGFKGADYTGTSRLVFGGSPQAIVKLDYDASSIGLDFGVVAPGIKKILLVPGAGQENHRIRQGTFDIYTSNDNLSYGLIARDDWEYSRDSNGVISITLKQARAMRYLKIHVWYDTRDMVLLPTNKATFINSLANMLRVYQEAFSRTEEYQYDEAGNRKLTRITLVQAEQYNSYYYLNSDRLKTDGKNAFKYDDAGNLTEKGNKYTINGDTVTFTATSGNGVEYWVYKYDLLNRLIEVKKNGTIVGEYGYDPEGLRVVKKVYSGGSQTDTIHYVFQGTEPIFEKRIKEGQADKIRSYVYAGTKLLARVDGLIGEQSHYDKDGNFINGKPVYFYHADHVGSVKAITNFDVVKDENDETKYINKSKVVWNADYLPFGQQYMKNKLDPDFEEDDLGFTGKGYDSDVGLYYFNARWYDADTGRFTSEDPVADPDNPNNYSYCANNPLSNTDPTGLYIAADGSEQVGPPERGDSGGGTGGGNPPTGGPGGGGSNTTNNYRKDGTLKNSRTIENNVQTTIYYKKDGTTVDHVSVIDNKTGMQTLTYFRENGVRSVTTFNGRGDIVD